MAAFLAALPLLLKLVLLVMDLVNKTPQEKRREALSDLDSAITKATDKNDLAELTKWFSQRL